MNRRLKTRIAFITAVLLSTLPVNAVAQIAEEEPLPAIRLGAPFADNAVLQRQMPVPVWGWSRPNTKITVQFAGQKKTGLVDDSGKWMLKLEPLIASFHPRELAISDNHGNQVALKNILVGEVWLASGQSNMQWKVQKSSSNQLTVEPVGVARVAPIREFEVTSVVAMPHPIEKADGEWKNGDYASYSAIAFAFAHRLYEELNVPVGILNCSFSQTSIQAWVPREGFREGKDEYTQAIYKKILQTDPATPQHEAAWNEYYQGIERTLKENAKRVSGGRPPRAISTKTPGNMNGNRDASWLFNGRLNPVVPYAIRGGIWNQGYANMGEGIPYYYNLHSLIRGWRLVWNRPELPVYFHQFYCPGGSEFGIPSIGTTAEMRLGTWLARDIPNTGMASQIDITGSIHYWNKAVPGQRLALHALKNQYGKNVAADGPMFKSYLVQGNKLLVHFDHAEGGLVVAETETNSDRRNKEATGFADPKVVENGDNRVKLFYLADDNRIWHPADLKIDGDRVVLTSPNVKSPRGVSYGSGGVGFQPSLYNRALLPMTPFIYYDNKVVARESWPEESLKIADMAVDPNTVGLKYDWRKMPLLSTQFRNNAVLQAGVPITIWGSANHDYGHEAEGDAVIKFSFAGVEKTIPVGDGSPNIFELGPGQTRGGPGAKEWRVSVPAMEPSAEPKTLKVTFLIDGEVAHQRICENIVIGDVWYVAAPQLKLEQLAVKPDANNLVRVMRRRAKRSSSPTASRYSVCVSRTPLNRFACTWDDANSDLAGVIGRRIAAKTGRPVGIIFMQNAVPKGGWNPELKSWIATDDLARAPSLMGDYKDRATVLPGNPYYDANVLRYIAAWKEYWSEYVPRMIATKRVPDRAAWGSYPTLASGVTSNAAETYNVLVHPFSLCSFKGIIFLTSPEMAAKKQGADFGQQLSVLANSWKRRFGGKDPYFYYTIPNKELATKITKPDAIEGRATAVEIADWAELSRLINEVVSSED